MKGQPISGERASAMPVSVDDRRISGFATDFPETTHAAARALAVLLTQAEAMGRETAASLLTEEISRLVDDDPRIRRWQQEARALRSLNDAIEKLSQAHQHLKEVQVKP